MSVKTAKIMFLSSLIALLGGAGVATAASINLQNPLCPSGSGGGSSCINNLTSLLATATTYLTTIIGSIAVIIFIWAGILFLTSAGDAGQVAQARRAVIYAVIGLAIALAGMGLVAVIGAVIGSPPSSSP